MIDPLAWMDDEAASRAAQGLTRSLAPLAGPAPHQLAAGGRPLVSFAGNDYLGLAADPRVVAAASDAARRFGWGSGASPLVSGWRTPHDDLAQHLASFEKCEAAAIFPTGFAANLGVSAALVGPGDAVYLDRLNHASLVSGARLSRACIRVFPHGDFARLQTILERDAGRFRRILIATESVFSMDGDVAPLEEFVSLAERFGAMLLVDEAHGTGVFGRDGRGAASELGVAERVPIRVGTLSKAVGSVGGFVVGSRRLVDHMINHSASLIYSTALPPAAAAAASTALEIMHAEPWRREAVRHSALELRNVLRGEGLAVLGVPECPIVPVVLGDPETVVRVSSLLREAGFLVPAIRPPTVPRGTSRLRLSVSAAQNPEDIRRLIGTLIEGIRIAGHGQTRTIESGAVLRSAAAESIMRSDRCELG